MSGSKKLKPKDISPEDYAAGWKTNIQLVQNWSRLQAEVIQLEEALARKREEIANLEEHFPILGNVKGQIKVASARVIVPIEDDEEVEVDFSEEETRSPSVKKVSTVPKKKGSTSRQRIASKLAPKPTATEARLANPNFVRHTHDRMDAEKTGNAE